MRSRQTGLTFIGWLVLLIPLVIVLFAGIKLAPLYMNQARVSKALEQTAESTKDGSTITVQTVRAEIGRRFDIDSIEFPALDDIMIQKEGDAWAVTAEYNREATLFGNVSLLVHFYKRVVLQ